GGGQLRHRHPHTSPDGKRRRGCCERRCGKGGCLAGPASEAGWSRCCRSCWHTESGNGGNGSPQPAPVFLFVGRSPETRCLCCRGRVRTVRPCAGEVGGTATTHKRPRAHDQWRGNQPQRRLPRPPPFQPALPPKESNPNVPACSSPARSGSERLRHPPQVGPQPMHPVRQNIPWHPEV